LGDALGDAAGDALTDMRKSCTIYKYGYE
jgi:hypothetical protein